MRRHLLSYYFYNTLISPFNQARIFVEQNKYNEIFRLGTLLSLQLKLDAMESSPPFYDYCELAEKLQLRNDLNLFFASIINIIGNIEVEKNSSKALQILDRLTAQAHFFNMLESFYNDPKQKIAQILYTTGVEHGIFSRPVVKMEDCHGNARFEMANVEFNSNIQTEYHEIIKYYSQLQTEEFKKLLFQVFSIKTPIDQNVLRAILGENPNLSKVQAFKQFEEISSKYWQEFNAELNTEISLVPCDELCEAVNRITMR